MQKISTMRRSGKNIFRGQLTIGLDLGDRFSAYTILSEAGEIVLEHKLATTPEAMKLVFGSMPRCRMAMETGTHSPWVSRLLAELGHEVIVGHAQKVRLITKSRRKDDRLDARTLARLARIDPELLSPVKHRSTQAQLHLAEIRARAGLVSARTALVNAARGLVKSYGERVRKCDTRQFRRETSGLSTGLREALEPLLSQIESLNEIIQKYDRRIEKMAKERYPQLLDPHFPRKKEAERSLIRWAAPTESRTPNWHRANIAHTRVRMEGWRQRRLGGSEKSKSVRYLPLTGTGLLMEGAKQGNPVQHRARFTITTMRRGRVSMWYQWFSDFGSRDLPHA